MYPLCTTCLASVVRTPVLCIRRTLTLAMAAGIGFFLAHIGYQAGEGIGLVVADPATLVTLGETRHPSAAASSALERALATSPGVFMCGPHSLQLYIQGCHAVWA